MSLLHFGTPGDNQFNLLLSRRHRLAAVDHLREASVVIQGDAVRAVVWAAILSLVLGLTCGPDPSPHFLSFPDKYPVFYPPRRTQSLLLYPL
jgi:hypothetical protein